MPKDNKYIKSQMYKIATLPFGNRFQNNKVARAVSEGGNGNWIVIFNFLKWLQRMLL